jgi:hypothetical protein
MTSDELHTLFLILPYGRNNATSIPSLCRQLDMSDRAVREGIQQLVDGELNNRRVPVVTLTTSPGVWIALTPEELDLADSHLRSKAMSLLHRRRSLRLCREELAWSPTLFQI